MTTEKQRAAREKKKARPFKGDVRQFQTAARAIVHLARDVETVILSERPTLGQVLQASDDIGECAIYSRQLDADLAIAAFDEYQAKHAKSNPRSSRKLDNAFKREREARAEVDRLQRDRDLSLAKIGELAGRFMGGEASAGQLLREASAEFDATSSQLTDAIERRNRAEFDYKRIVAPGQINPRKRKAKRKTSARPNPEIVEPPEHLPTAIIPPSTFALLGECVEVEIKSTRGRAHRLIAPRANSCALLASADAQTLWLVWPSSTRHTRKPKGAEASAAAKLYRKWSKFKARVALKMEASDRGPREKIGEVIAIRYRSDKWSGEPTLYEHKFTSHNVRAYADNKRAPRMIAIFDPNGRVLVTESGITG